MDEQMYCRQCLCRIACEDLSDKDGCVVAQIVETVTQERRVKVSGKKGDQAGGKDGRNRPCVQVPR